MFIVNNEYWRIQFAPWGSQVLIRPNGELALGMCDSNTHTIYIADWLDSDTTRRVLCHEVTHAAMFSYGIRLTYDEEELVADIISTFGEEIISITNRVFHALKERFAA